MVGTPQKLSINRGTVYYYVYGQPSKIDTKYLSDFKQEIKDALACWQQISNFTFEEIPYEKEHYTYPNLSPRINFRFGTVSNGLHSAETTQYQNSPTETVFNDDMVWSSVRAMIDSGVLVDTNSAQDLVVALGKNDLWTVALHEIGHCLGLPDAPLTHVLKTTIMYPIDLFDFRTGFFMRERRLPVEDAIDLGQLYSISTPPAPPLPKLDTGYLIVGGRFDVTSSNSKAMPVSELVWGEDTGPNRLVCVGQGYCYNDNLRGGEGYGYLYLYLLEASLLKNDMVVATGGYQMHYDGQDKIPGGSNPALRRRWGSPLSATDKAIEIGHFRSWDPDANVASYCMVYLTMKPAEDLASDGVRVCGGQTRIGDSQFNNIYVDRSWGLTTNRQVVDIARARTNGKYDRAMSDIQFALSPL
jgi:hypothetical protein